MSDTRRHHRKRRTIHSKNVATTEELAVSWVLKAAFVLVAVGIAAGITYMASR